EPLHLSGTVGEVLETGSDWITVGTSDGAVKLTGLKALSEAAALPAVAEQLDQNHADLAAAQDKMLADEAYWCAALRRAQPFDVPLALGQASGAVASVTIPLPAGADAVAGILAAMSLGAGQGAGDIGHAVTPAANGLMLPWVPLRSDRPLDQQLARIKETGGFAADLAQRDAAITLDQPSIMLAQAPVAGAAVTAVIGAEAITLHGDTGLLDEGAMQILAARVTHCLSGAEGLPEAETTLLMQTWNATQTAYDADPIHSKFETQVTKTPEATALAFEDQSFTYGQLNTRANKLAHRLRAMGVTTGTPVGLSTSRGPDLLIGALGILKAGGAYVPLDPAYPEDRIAHYIADSGAPVIVTQSALAQGLPKGDAT
ncbi:MAG: AMP-binding protein, partial [Marinomonas sp.]